MATVAVTGVPETTGARAPSPDVISAIATFGLIAGALSFVLALTSDHVNGPGLQAALMNWVTLPYIFGGLIAWWRRPDSRLGILMILAGFTMFVSNLAWTDIPSLHTIGQAADLLPAALLLHLFLAYPSGRLQHAFDRALVVFAYVTAFGLELVGMLLGGFGPNNLLEVTSQPHAAELLLSAQLVALSACALTGVVLLARRRGEWRSQRPSHALLFDSFSLGLVMIALLFTTAAFDGPGFETIRRATLVVLGLTPIAFLSGLLGARLARSAVADLMVELRRNPAAADLPDALARAVRDPSLELAYWLPQFGAYVDLEGGLVELPPHGNVRRRTTMIVRDGRRVAALVHDRSLDDEPELLEAVSAAAGIALENARLHAELGARLDELQGSRARVLQAGQQERQRLERDLHDGAQQRLIALSLQLGMLEVRLGDDPDARTKLEEARREIALSLEELRAVAHGIHPAVVSGHGLGVALEQLAARAAVPVRLTVELESRLPEQLEVAAYYVVSESLVNIDKHAHASTATVGVARSNGQLVVEIVDDGVGGADTERGTGLRGLADRVEALGGSLRIWTSSRTGTRVRADLPCA